MAREADALILVLGYRFARRELLEEALTHSSTAAGGADFQRLEFLGDRVLGVSVAAQLYRLFPDEPEGALAVRYASLVSRPTLAGIARAQRLDHHIAMASEMVAGDRVLADALEAVIGAVFLDGGFAAADALVERLWSPLVAGDAPARDAKTVLQEWAQARGKPLPEYTMIASEGPQHEPMFTVTATVAGHLPAEGRAGTKRAAEQAAAHALNAVLLRAT